MSEPEIIFSVIIPCYNRAVFLPETVASLLRQGEGRLETVIVNDGSSDGSGQVAARLADKFPGLRIRCINQENLGPSAARNAGIAAAKGSWITPLDSDDILADGFLGALSKAFEEYPEANAFTGAYKEFTGAEGVGGVDCQGGLGGQCGPDEPDGSGNLAAESIWKLSRYDAGRLKEKCNLLCTTTYKKELWEKSGGYDPSNPFGIEDWHFWLKAQLHGFSPVCLPIAMLRYRIHGDNMSIALRERHDDAHAMHHTMLPEIYGRERVLAAHDRLLRMSEAAEAAINRKISRLPRLPLPYFWLGLAHEGRKEKALAAASYRKALSLPWPGADPNGPSGAWQAELRLGGL